MPTRRLFRLIVALVVSGATGVATAQEAPKPADLQPASLYDSAEIPRNSIAIFAGVFTTSFWARSFNINEVGYEPNYVVAIISSHDFLVTDWGLRIGHESGIAIRFGSEFSVETWRGVTISFGSELRNNSVVTPRLVLGLSSISNPIGVEALREAEVENGDAARLVYLGSELARSLGAFPSVEVFYRLHHRSGAIGFWGNIAAGHNANGVGLRLWY